MPEKKYVFVTGGTGAIGSAIAKNIAFNQIYQVVIIARDEYKAKKTTDWISKITGYDNVSFKIVDLSDPEEIYHFADMWDKPLHVLINNAAITPRKRMENKHGVELQFATNILGYYSMMDAFADHLSQIPQSRIINVASYWAGGLDFSDLEFKQRIYNNDIAYRQSKQANRMLSVAFAERLRNVKIRVNSCHPGDVNSNLSNDLGFGGHESPDQGAETPVWLATQNAGIVHTGKYFEHKELTICQFSKDEESIRKLYDICTNYI